MGGVDVQQAQFVLADTAASRWVQSDVSSRMEAEGSKCRLERIANLCGGARTAGAVELQHNSRPTFLIRYPLP